MHAVLTWPRLSAGHLATCCTSSPRPSRPAWTFGLTFNSSQTTKTQKKETTNQKLEPTRDNGKFFILFYYFDFPSVLLLFFFFNLKIRERKNNHTNQPTNRDTKQWNIQERQCEKSKATCSPCSHEEGSSTEGAAVLGPTLP